MTLNLFFIDKCLGEDGAGRCAGRSLVCPCFIVSSFTTLLLGTRRGLPAPDPAIFDCDTPLRSF